MSDTVRIKVRNAMGVEKTDLEVPAGKVALVAGRNFAGKSSLLQAIGAAVTGNAMVRGIATKKNADRLVRDGAKAGRVLVETDRGSSLVRWPGCEHETKGFVPEANSYAIGTAQLARVDAKARSEALVEILQATPAREDLDKALEDSGVRSETLDKVWARIEREGWDATGADLRDRGIGLKQQWADITGGSWGSRKGESWIPHDFDDYDEALERSDYEAALAEAKSRLEHAIAHQAVSRERIEELNRRIAAGKEAEAKLETIDGQVRELETELEEKAKVLAALPPTDKKVSEKPCPHCGKPLKLVKRGVVLVIEASNAEAISETELKKRRMDVATADGAVANVNHRLQTALGERLSAEQDRNAGVKAETDLELIDTTKDGAVDLEPVRQEVVQAEFNLDAFDRLTKAAAKHIQIVQNLAMLDAVAPAGVRQSKLSENLAGFNATLNRVIRRFDNKQLQYKAPKLSIGDDLSITLGARPYGLLSESEQFRVDAVIQSALAALTNAPLLLVDRADVLHPQDRPGLLRVLRASRKPSIVAMTAKDEEWLPDLRSAGWGSCWWMEAGVLSPTER